MKVKTDFPTSGLYRAIQPCMYIQKWLSTELIESCISLDNRQ